MSDRSRENEWFQNFEQEMIRDAKRKRDLAAAAERTAEDEKLKKLHWLKCPKCGHDMTSLELEGITLDQCSHCEGIYFDRGELDELLLKKAEERKGVFRRLSGILS